MEKNKEGPLDSLIDEFIDVDRSMHYACRTNEYVESCDDNGVPCIRIDPSVNEIYIDIDIYIYILYVSHDDCHTMTGSNVKCA
jgi:hypothetical protein